MIDSYADEFFKKADIENARKESNGIPPKWYRPTKKDSWGYESWIIHKYRIISSKPEVGRESDKIFLMPFIEFKDWLHQYPNKKQIFKDWRDSSYHKDYQPTVDRVDQASNYIKGNIRLCALKNNIEIGVQSDYSKERSAGHRMPRDIYGNWKSVAVEAYIKIKGDLIYQESFNTIADADEWAGITHHGAISEIFKYEEEHPDRLHARSAGKHPGYVRGKVLEEYREMKIYWKEAKSLAHTPW